MGRGPARTHLVVATSFFLEELTVRCHDLLVEVMTLYRDLFVWGVLLSIQLESSIASTVMD